jgi:iron complex transport system permease protein
MATTTATRADPASASGSRARAAVSHSAIFAALIAVLALSGAALQGIFRNPLVDPHVIGVSSGAAFGGVIAILLELGGATLFGLSFLLGLCAVMLVLVLSRESGRSPILMVILRAS